MAEKTVNVLGHKMNKETLFIAGLAGVAALGWAWYKNKETKAAAATAATTPTTGQAVATNPYGYAYGYGGYSPYGYGYGPFGLGAYGGEGLYGYGYYGAGTPQEMVPAAATTNQQWSEAAVTALTASGNQSSDTVLAALGLYLTGGALNSSQVSIVQEAIAAEGYPPIPGASGYPPSINTGGSQSTSTTPAAGQSTPSANGMVVVPNVANMEAVDAQQVLRSSGLNPVITLTAAANKPGIYHIITKTNPPAGASVAKGTSVTLYYKTSTTANPQPQP